MTSQLADGAVRERAGADRRFEQALKPPKRPR